MAINKRKSRVQPKPAKKSYTKKSVDAAYREVQTKMRKEVTKLQKIKNPLDNTNISPNYFTNKEPGPDYSLSTANQFNVGMKRMQDIGMKARAKRTKAISAAAKKHGVPKSQITARTPINPGEIASKKAREWRSKR
tara:strand:+ start:2968 stop:3375 length:408 start_codon:yes stop_codon:yes gene_type:complete